MSGLSTDGQYDSWYCNICKMYISDLVKHNNEYHEIPIYLVIITADTNDADFISNEKEMTKTQVTRLKKIWSKIKECNFKDNWYTMDLGHQLSPNELYFDILSESDIEFFGDLVPYGTDGIHTVHSIEIYKFIDKETLI
jgi:hypothetical protein